jgi:hypothetical protein
MSMFGRMELGKLSAIPAGWSSARSRRVSARGPLASWRRRSGEIVRLCVAAVVRCRRRAVPQLDLLDRARRIAGHGTVRVRCRVHLAAGCQLGRRSAES